MNTVHLVVQQCRVYPTFLLKEEDRFGFPELRVFKYSHQIVIIIIIIIKMLDKKPLQYVL